MKTFHLFSFLCILTLLPSVFSRGVNGGMDCAVCTVLTGVVMQVAEIHEEDFLNATKRLCNGLPERVRNYCFEIVDKVQPYLENVSEKLTPDVFCLIYGTCKADNRGNLCHLFPELGKNELKKVVENENAYRLPKINFCELPYICDICKILNNSYISLNPIEDYDKDGFSAIATGRGFDWRGRDCEDNIQDFHPGRKPLNSDFFSDSNCNGISGFNNITYQTWEQILCETSESRGLVYIGDSIGAHFHMPEVWINPLLFTWPGLNASNVVLDEIDWPQFGFATGYKNITKNVLISGDTDSIYLRLRNRNLCNHRDYQNLAQNGASSYDGLNHASALSRNQSTDKPAIVIYAMQGNDVCTNINDPNMDYTTTPVVFRKNVMKTLALLDEKLPPNSHVVLMELVEADFIYDAMADKVHPIGSLHKNVFYKDMYNWFNCLQIGPCNGWLNSNKTLRQETSKKARRLSKVLRHIANTEKFDHFVVHYIKNPITHMVKKHKLNISELLEAVDSLHPNQNAQPLMSKVVWQFLEELPSEVLGPVNPKNDLIKALFGDQDGH